MENTTIKKIVILLNGASSSGKSTLADTLQEILINRRSEEYDIEHINI